MKKIVRLTVKFGAAEVEDSTIPLAGETVGQAARRLIENIEAREEREFSSVHIKTETHE